VVVVAVGAAAAAEGEAFPAEAAVLVAAAREEVGEGVKMTNDE
jgi:hypothetical protein